MAERAADQEDSVCPECSGLLKDPVTVPCGLSFCRKCVTMSWDREDFRLDPVSNIPSPAEPQTRQDFLQYAKQITLDPNTANKHLQLSDGNRRVTYGRVQRVPDHPERFSQWPQVLSREALTGRCYWEVECSGWWVSVCVSPKDIPRKRRSHISRFGHNNKSWALYCNAFSETVKIYWNSSESEVHGIGPGPVGSRIGVYLDHDAGFLSFHSVSQNMGPLYRHSTFFNEPLYAGVGICDIKGASAHFITLT